MPRILIIDDNEDLAVIWRSFLGSLGHTVEIRHDLMTGREALAQVEFDLLILDGKLPDGSGLDLAREMRDADAATKVVIVSGHVPRPEDSRLKSESGADRWLKKPVDLDKLSGVVDELGGA